MPQVKPMCGRKDQFRVIPIPYFSVQTVPNLDVSSTADSIRVTSFLNFYEVGTKYRPNSVPEHINKMSDGIV